VIGLLTSLAKVAAMKKRIQINVSLEDSEIGNINEYCRAYGITPQGLFKAGAQRLIDEDILERKADIMTLRSWREIGEGLSEPIDDLLEMIEEDRRLGDKIALSEHHADRRSA
jgi:hypothetical protein